jgi:class 3 adenylate cyclase/tetratricopeptide (TPR) repeat protein
MNRQAGVVQKLIDLLGTWGWELGYKKLESEIASSGVDPGPEVRAFFLAWIAAERGDYAEAEEQVRRMAGNPLLVRWGKFVRAFIALRRREFSNCEQLLDEVELPAADGDPQLLAAVCHIRGTLCYHQGKSEEALRHLTEALGKLGGVESGHFGVGRVLDTLGMIYVSRDNFHIAREFFRKSLELKRQQGDRAGEALSNGQLGRLYAGWGLWPLAEKHFREDLRLCKAIFDTRGEAQTCNLLGQAALAQENTKDAADWLDESIRLCQGKAGWEVLEGYARKDRALAFIAAGSEVELASAAEQLGRAEKLFGQVTPLFVEGIAHVDRTWGVLHRLRGESSESMQRLHEALRHFQGVGELVEVARTQLEMARTQQMTGASGAPIREALLTALETAENSRRGELVRCIEKELRAKFPDAYYANVCRRLRGGAADGDAASLMDGRTEPISVLFLDIQGSTNFVRDHDPAEVMLTLNQLMADLVGVLRKHEAHVNVFRGDGFMALVRGEHHARRAVEAALDMNESIRRFNEPREKLLKLPVLAARIGISTGDAYLGNVGTYDKMDFTALGKAVNLGARLEPAAVPGEPCISRATREQIGDQFVFRDPNGREIKAKGFEPELVRVWDVIRLSR